MNVQLKASADFDASVRLKSRKVPCFSLKYLKENHPDGHTVVGEVSGRSEKKAIGTIQISRERLDIAQEGSHSRLLWSRAGYLQVEGDRYVAVLRSRVPFFLILLGLLGALLVLLMLLRTGPTPGYTPGQNPGQTPEQNPGQNPGSGPIVITPDHPLPPVDNNATPNEGDNSQKADHAEGGGSVSMVYSLDCAMNLSAGDIGIYFKNPNASSHDVTVDLYIVSGGEEYLIAQSGILKAGYSLNKLTALPNGPVLSEGIYGGLFRLHCYDPITGEQAMVVPEITGLKITVNN